ncbi:restriction endonuclease subunit S [Acinetobacter nosocomialis]|uniref:restriction endonuclease subunit S n=1 Tax=Acinetobacter nosocomialis TaxID=106654 RepID=UPI000B3D9A37|nr:restriction endonuclease subunit S [Acinetobacter nosocomialis]MBD0443690.1 restriction endonuclease subunit S [Acinetobacter nosocomialis]MDH2636229.1 restriction endonuclease subunit S [Acinetobacter nosocomialis]MDQ9042259.1 restriction endonuclease subunit S [Acinetobacter nosocomialis]MDR9534125.1 restriction endonuclease subunit S [Acinetobacter nosocomialis]OUT25962.1 restriction modification system DNA specificity domain-containing protein [Acinetobacter nosocomialis P020]
MGKYQKYAEYKESGVEWLGEIPSHWDCFSGKRIFASVRKAAYETDQQLAASQKYGVIPQKLMMELNDSKVMLALKGTDSFRHVDVNNFVISLRSFEGGIEYSEYTGCVSPAYTVLQNKKAISYAYFKYLFKSASYIAALQSTTDSLRDGKSISYEQFGGIPLPLCNIDEQQGIATFLDHETAKIDTLIAKQEKLIELLKEKRQAVISHAVTKGLNPNVQMKDSGVEWLGEVPEHWEVRQLRYLGSCQNGINIGAEYFGSGSSFISYGDVYRNPELPRVFDGLVESTENDKRIYSVQRGDVLFTRTSETIEEIGFSSTCLTDVKDATFAGFLIRFRPIHNTLLPEYSKFYFRNILLRAFFVKEMNLVTRASLSQELLKKLAVPFPSLEEQKQIADYLSAKERVFDKLVNNCIKQIELLKERRTALISAAVTGKIDVRNWQNPVKNNNQDNMELSA